MFRWCASVIERIHGVTINVVFLWKAALPMSSLYSLKKNSLYSNIINVFKKYTNWVNEWANELAGSTFNFSTQCSQYCSRFFPIYVTCDFLCHVCYGSKEAVLRCIQTKTNREKCTASNQYRKTSFWVRQVSQVSDPLRKATKCRHLCK